MTLACFSLPSGGLRWCCPQAMAAYHGPAHCCLYCSLPTGGLRWSCLRTMATKRWPPCCPGTRLKRQTSGGACPQRSSWKRTARRTRCAAARVWLCCAVGGCGCTWVGLHVSGCVQKAGAAMRVAVWQAVVGRLRCTDQQGRRLACGRLPTAPHRKSNRCQPHPTLPPNAHLTAAARPLLQRL